jgi:2-polyprenyl-3-methyl-5-hydroxy-6-metoxy-1,4-benzoquinol methylase
MIPASVQSGQPPCSGPDTISGMSVEHGNIVDDGLHERRRRGYESPRWDVQAAVPEHVQRILELGCATGALGAALKARNGADVVGVEIDPDYAKQAAQRLDRVVVANAESFVRDEPTPPEAPFDCIIGADVFEHLVDPWTTLQLATGMLESGGTVVVSVPNVLYLPALWAVLVGGRWPREDEGIFDRTHLRWFTMQDAIEFVCGAGLRLNRVYPNYPGRGARHALMRLLGHTPVRRFLPVQWIVVGVKA